MKIGMISHWYDPEGGAAAGPGTIARALRDRGHDVHVVTGYPIYPAGKVFDGYQIRPYQREQLDGITVHRFPAYPSHDDRASRRMVNYLSFAVSGSAGALWVLRDADVLFVYSTPATVGAAGVLLRLLAGKPYVVQIQDLWPDTVITSGFIHHAKHARVAEQLLNIACNTVYRFAQNVAVTSTGMTDILLKRGVPRSKLVFIPNWAEERSFFPVEKDESLRSEMGIPTGPFIAMYAGNFGEQQSLETLLYAAERLRHRHDILIALVGSGVAEDRLREMASQLSLDNVIFCPPQPFSRMAKVLALGDIQVVTLKDVPLYRATLPSKIQANLACGRPTVAAIAGDGGQLVRDAGGASVAPGDSEALAQEIIRMADLSARDLRALEIRARRHYLANYSEKILGDRLSEVLENAEKGASK